MRTLMLVISVAACSKPSTTTPVAKPQTSIEIPAGSRRAILVARTTVNATNGISGELKARSCIDLPPNADRISFAMDGWLVSFDDGTCRAFHKTEHERMQEAEERLGAAPRTDGETGD